MTTLKNSVQLIGRLGKDPVVKNIGADRKMATFSMATNETYTNKMGERVENATWHNVVAFGKVVEIIEKYVHKGQEIAIEGKLTSNTWEDKDGKKRYSVDIVINELVLLQKVS
jgi:single-strand DNA-binding protein